MSASAWGCRLSVPDPHGRIVHRLIQRLNLLTVVRKVRPRQVGEGSRSSNRSQLPGNRLCVTVVPACGGVGRFGNGSQAQSRTGQQWERKKPGDALQES